MLPYVIRSATPDDAAGIVTHMKIISGQPYNGILWAPGEYRRSAEEQRAIMTEYVGYRHWFVAIADDGVIGIVSIGSGTRLSEQHTFGLGISVNPEWRDQGVGSALMKRMIDWAKANPKVHRLELEVFTNNPRAIHVYEKLGFITEGRKQHAYFKDGAFQDTLMMAIILDH